MVELEYGEMDYRNGQVRAIVADLMIRGFRAEAIRPENSTDEKDGRDPPVPGRFFQGREIGTMSYF